MTAGPDGETVVTSAVRRARKWPMMLAMLIVFISGGVIGSGLTILLCPGGDSSVGRHRTAAKRAAEYADFYAAEFDLSDEQKAAAREIMEDCITRFREDFRPQMRRVIDKLRADMAAILDDDQKAAWDAYCEKRFAHVYKDEDEQ